MTMTKEEAQEIQDRLIKFEAWLDSRRDKSGWASYKAEDLPIGLVEVSNEERSAFEVYQFVACPPERYTLYINEPTKLATTWLGDRLGTVVFMREWIDNFGGTRVSIRVNGINNKRYSGTYFKSKGDYARVKRIKG